ncbi:MAG TPA: LLM class flavin-dependent oxidoreductase [Chloroflexota bacterium]|jgi:alkanesulfonate monooxygenase SsuD/methylene tetrahydromethanopterin reductase-like flavin-dependent oxidoreductase (luciferase family)
MARPEVDEARRATSPLFGANRVKLGLFGFNCDYGCTSTTAEGRWELGWPATKALATLADQAGIEALVPIARWRGFGGPTNFNGASYETYTWAAGLGAATERTAVFSTSHVPTVHPIMAAKQATTIDHISNGRFALNVVCGWFEPELKMFGAAPMEHDTAYMYAAEWLDVMRRLWTAEEEFDYEGRFFKITRGFHEPKPLQRPFPPIMNAGSSPVGRRFAAQHADMAFINARQGARENYQADVANLRRLAREEFGRELQVWGHSYVVCRPTETEARDALHYYVRERGDWQAIDNLVRGMGLDRVLPPAALDAVRFDFVAGWGGYPLVGTPEQIVDELRAMAAVGFDGWMLSWLNYQAELEQWTREVMPLLEQAGLRAPFRPWT